MRRAGLCLGVLFAFFWVGAVGATPANKKGLENHFGRFLDPGLQNCSTCHLPSEVEEPENLEEFPHNPFGDRLRTLKKEAGVRGIGERLGRIAGEDSDGDGVSNLVEILLGANPGEKKDAPEMGAREKELAAREMEYAAFAERYSWRPFETVGRPEVPRVDRANWVRNEVDSFVGAEHEKRGLAPRPEAAKEVRLRRVYLDLIGLAPTPSQVRAFLADDSADAYEKVVEELLASPRYGERWGRHWMDIWRYSDWAGYKKAVRNSQPHIWRWRDWIVEALNEDKGYNTMIVEMLAADEALPEDEEALRATGFLVRNFHASNRDQWLDEVVTHTSQAFLGVTMGCVKCHDHMYDPIPQEDYYRMRAIFEPYHVRTDQVPGELDTKKAGMARAFDRTMTAKTYLFERGDERRRVKDKVMEPGVPELLGGEFAVVPVSLPALAHEPHKRPFVKKEMMSAEVSESRKARDLLERAKKEKEGAEKIEELELKLAVAESREVSLRALFEVEQIEDGGKKKTPEWEKAARRTAAAQREAAYLDAKWKLKAAQNALQIAVRSKKVAEEKGDKKKIAAYEKQIVAKKKAIPAAEKVLAKAKKVNEAEGTKEYTVRQKDPYPSESTGRRLAFAKWLSAEGNPLTARVAMNHIWLRHFGEPIVPTVAEFGANGRPPQHPALLDWLAAEFMERDWSMKEMHRILVTSATYRMEGTMDEANAAIDSDNVYLWRKRARRMEGEIVRDNLLHMAGQLDLAMGGPEIDNKEDMVSKRRSIYLRHAHEKLAEFVQIFDGPKVSECYRREESIQPHQALALANSRISTEQAQILAGRLREGAGKDDIAFVREAFLTVLGRLPDGEETEACLKFLKDEGVEERGGPARAGERLVGVLFNHNDFVTIR